MYDFKIRPYRKEDRPDVRRIACETAFVREGSGNFLPDDEVLADILTLYFTDYESESCLVALSGRHIAGYLTGCTRPGRHKKIQMLQVAPLVLLKAVKKGLIFKKSTMAFTRACAAGFLKGELIHPDFSAEYPAELHINISEDYRGQGAGTKLITEFFAYLKTKGVKAVRTATISEDGRRFFTKSGFKLLFEKKIPSLSRLLDRDVAYCIFGRKV